MCSRFIILQDHFATVCWSANLIACFSSIIRIVKCNWEEDHSSVHSFLEISGTVWGRYPGRYWEFLPTRKLPSNPAEDNGSGGSAHRARNLHHLGEGTLHSSRWRFVQWNKPIILKGRRRHAQPFFREKNKFPFLNSSFRRQTNLSKNL